MESPEINYSTCRKFILANSKGMRTSDETTKALQEILKSIALKIVEDAAILADEDKKKTILVESLTKAANKYTNIQ